MMFLTALLDVFLAYKVWPHGWVHDVFVAFAGFSTAIVLEEGV